MKEYEIRKILAEILELSMEDILKIGSNENLRGYSLNSLNSIKLVVRIEDKIQKEIDNSDLLLEHWDTIEKIETLLKKYV